MYEDDEISTMSMSKSDGSLIHVVAAANSSKNTVFGFFSGNNTPRIKKLSKRRKKKKKEKNVDGDDIRRKRNGKKKKKKTSRRSSSVEDNKNRKSSNTREYTAACSSRSENISLDRDLIIGKSSQKQQQHLKKKFGVHLGQKLIEKTGRTALLECVKVMTDERGIKHGLVAIVGTKRYYLVKNAVEDKEPVFVTGTYGAVSKGWDSELNRFVAIKRQNIASLPIPPKFNIEGEIEKELLLERQTTTTISSLAPFREVAIMRFVLESPTLSQDAENVHSVVRQEGAKAVIPLLDSFYIPHTKNHYIVTPYSDLGDLFFLFDNKEYLCKQEKRKYAQIVQSLFGDMASSIYYLHSMGICHGDVKLENFILFWDAERKRFCARLTDFGLSQFSHPEKLTLLTTLTPLYSSPEQNLAALKELCYNNSVDKSKRDYIGEYVLATPFSAHNESARIRVASRMLSVPDAIYPAGTADVWGLAVCLYVFVFEVHPFGANDNENWSSLSQIEIVGKIREKQTKFFSSVGYWDEPCPKMKKEQGALEVIDAVFQEAWSVRPSALQIVQHFSWVREAVVKDCDKECKSFGLLVNSAQSTIPTNEEIDAWSIETTEGSPCLLSPFSKLMRENCGTEIALQYE